MLIELLRSILFLSVLFAVGIGYWQSGLRKYSNAYTKWAVVLLAGGNILFMIVLVFNHVAFPLNLEAMEMTVLQHVVRLASGQAIYATPSPEFVPLAYNPLYYVISVPIIKVLGTSITNLRIMSIIAILGIGIMVFVIVRDQTRSNWWPFIAVGLFAAAYRVMDTYLDNAHSDGWFVFTALLGTYIISKNRSYASNLLGVVVLIASFWFKQHGVVFVAGAILFLLWRDGWLKSISYAVAAGILGAGTYLFLGPVLFGPDFLYFTFQVPRHWSVVNLLTFYRYLRFILQNYPILAFFGVLESVWTVTSSYRKLTIWHFQFAAAVLTGIMGSLDPGSNNNVYIPMGIWFILMGTLGIYHGTQYIPLIRRHNLDKFLFATSFAIFLYLPATVIIPPQAQQVYQDFIQTLSGLHAQVYAPLIGQLPSNYTFEPAAHWVAMDDIIRGPGIDEYDAPITRQLLQSVIQPGGAAYIIIPYQLEGDGLLGFLSQYYVLDTDFGDRFKLLSTLPKRYGNGWPRYLYRYDPQAAKSAKSG